MLWLWLHWLWTDKVLAVSTSSLILSYKYHCRFSDRASGVTKSGRLWQDGFQVGSFSMLISFSSSLLPFLTNTTPGVVDATFRTEDFSKNITWCYLHLHSYFRRPSHICDWICKNRSKSHRNWNPFYCWTLKLNSCTNQKRLTHGHRWPSLLS